MNDPKNIGYPPDQRQLLSLYPAVVVFLSLVALVSTYFLATSSLEVSIKTQGFSGIIAVFLLLCVSFHLWQKRSGLSDLESESLQDATIERQLVALDEANEFFAGSLRSGDIFRLIASRVRELVPFRTMTLQVLDDSRERFRAVETEGPEAEHRLGRYSGLTDGIVARSYFSQVVEIDHGTTSARPSVAIPLRNGLEVFGVLHMDFDIGLASNNIDPMLLDAIGTRSAPLVLSAVSYERSQANALTDATTDLPNERAFYLVLENQVAESSRKGVARPLTILALDVQSFDAINNRFGHAAGDRVLNFVAQVIKDNLRQMDFFARATADEFLVILPTASREISHEVIGRIHAGFFGRKLQITDDESVELDLNVGWAAFGTDGETPATLLSVARTRKEQAKSTAPNKVLWFPTEFAS